ncbi:hypothetical protein [Nocardia sp. alder85J]|uniref:hypothetical protein n=1 Tax=Nocardia sp. alder85J TaxID=2862949 RepID=UPI001CD1D170|nr:hypothetical protein [Nocardia sp. alder85J]MCX4091501.1 hypothetical protein [Nocardia sp. alder85J]
MDIRGSWDTVTAALGQVSGPGRRSGDWVRYLCPVHEADGRRHHPSLGVVYNRGKRKTIVRCFAGCRDEDILARLGLRVRDLFDGPPPARPARTAATGRAVTLADRAILAAGLPLTVCKPDLGPATGPGRVAATYLYTDPGGRPRGRVIRVHTPHRSGRAKHFWQQRWAETGWCNGGFGAVPYRLPDLLTGIAAGADIYVCEGEADTDTARHAGAIATTNAGGAHNWRPEHAACLQGAAQVWIVADRDPPGYRRAAAVAGTLLGLVDRIRIVQARDGKDFTDHVDAGHDLSDLDPIPLLDDHFRYLAE